MEKEVVVRFPIIISAVDRGEQTKIQKKINSIMVGQEYIRGGTPMALLPEIEKHPNCEKLKNLHRVLAGNMNLECVLFDDGSWEVAEVDNKTVKPSTIKSPLQELVDLFRSEKDVIVE